MQCQACGADNPPANKFCGGCGAAIGADQAPPRASGPEADLVGKRRQATVLFADTVGSTNLAETLGEEKTYLLLNRVLGVMVDTVYAYEGTVPEMSGDGVMALFGAPVAVEDAPLRACRAAFEIHEKIAAQSDAIEAEFGVRPQARVGIHTGPVVVGEVGSKKRLDVTAQGDTVNLAARLESLAEPGGVIVSEATHRLVEGYVESSFGGEHDIKGKAEPQRVYALSAIKEGVTRFDVALARGLTSLVGRQDELETLEQAWEEALGGQMRVVGVSGEAGIGKSRLVHEFWQRAGGEDMYRLEGHCTADGAAMPFLPFIEVTRNSFRIGDGASQGEIERRLQRGLEILGLSLDDTLPYLMNLLGHAPLGAEFANLGHEVVGIRTRDAIIAMTRARCAMTPTCLFIDDLHWIDSASEELLGRIAAEDRDLPLLFLHTHRPHYAPPWSNDNGALDIRLGPLSSDATIDLLKDRLGTDDLPGEVTRLIVDKSEGNPLFAEEIASYLLARGSLQKDESGISYHAEESEPVLAVSLENLLLNRFDRLDEGPRAMLEAAAVVGQRFEAGTAAAAAGMNGRAPVMFRELEREEVIVREPETGEYAFRHSLARDAIYDSLLSTRREALHQRIAEHLEQRQGETGDAAETLAHHYSRTPLAEKAVKYLALAGERSLKVYSLDEADLYFRQAIELIEKVPDCADDQVLADILIHKARIHYFRCEMFEIIALAERFLPRVEALGDKKRLSRFVFEAGYAYVFSGQIGSGLPLLERAKALGEEIGDEESIAYPLIGFMWAEIYWPTSIADRHRKLEEMCRHIVETGKRVNNSWIVCKAYLALAIDGLAWGRLEDGRRVCLDLLEYGRQSGDPRAKSMGLWSMSLLNSVAGDFNEAIENAEEALRTSLCPLDRALAELAKANSYIFAGRAEEGRKLLQEMLHDLDDRGLTFSLVLFKAYLGVAMVLTGDMAAGIRQIENAAREYVGRGQPLAQAIGDFALGKTYSAIALGGEKPSLAVMLKNLGFVLGTVPFAASKARKHLQAAERIWRANDTPYYLADTLAGLADLDKAKKKPDAARARLEEAAAIAKSIDADTLSERIGQALAELG